MRRYSLRHATRVLHDASLKVKARMGIVESMVEPEATQPTWERLRVLELRVANLEHGPGQEQVAPETPALPGAPTGTARGESGQSDGVSESARASEPKKHVMESKKDNVCEYGQSAMSPKLHEPLRLGAELTDAGTGGASTEEGGKLQSATETTVAELGLFQLQDPARTSGSGRNTRVSHDEVYEQKGMCEQAVSSTTGQSGLGSIGTLQRHISSLEKHYAGVAADIRLLQESVQKILAHNKDLTEMHGTLRDGMWKLQQHLNTTIAASAEKEGTSQKRLSEVEGSQQQIVASASEAQKKVLALSRRVAAVELTHMNAERAATVAAAETKDLWQRLTSLEGLLGSRDSLQETPDVQMRSRSIDSALSYQGARVDPHVVPSSSGPRSPDTRSRTGAPRSFINWPWRP